MSKLKLLVLAFLIALILFNHPWRQGPKPPAPTPTPTPSGDPVVDYLTWSLAIDEKCAAALDQFNSYNQQSLNDPRTDSDPSWQQSVTNALIAIDNSCGTYARISPVPQELKVYHEKYVEAAQDYKMFTASYADGVGRMTAETREKADKWLTAANARIDEAGSFLPTQ